MRPIYLIYCMSIIVLILSCGKEDLKNSSNSEQTIQTPLSTSFNSDLSVTEIKSQINAFKNRIELLKKGEIISLRDEDMTLEELSWNIEATVNTVYGRIDAPFSLIDEERFEVTVSTNDGLVNNQAILSAFEATVDNLNQHYDSIEGDSKQVLFVDLKMTESNSTEAKFQVKTSIGKDLDASNIITGPQYDCVDSFEQGDSWYCCQQKGNCLDPMYDGLADASDVLEQKINQILRAQLPFNNVLDMSLAITDGILIDHIFTQFPSYIDIDFLNPNDDQPGDDYRDYRMYQKFAIGDEIENIPCLSDEDMDFYLCELLEIIEEIGEQIDAAGPNVEPIFWVVVNVNIFDVDGDGKEDYWFHAGINWGTLIQCDCPNPCPPDPNGGFQCSCC